MIISIGRRLAAIGSLGVAITREALDDNLYRETFGGDREQTGVAVTRSNMRDLLLPGLREIGNRYYVDRAGLAEARYTGLAQLRNEGGATVFDNAPGERYVWQVEHNAYGLGVAITSYETVARSKERARGLLKSLLTDEQWLEFEASRKVTERIDGCEFELTPGGMIEARKPRILGRNRFVAERWCVSPDPYADKNDYMPDEDKLIGQLLHLRAGPDKLRAQANVFPA